MTTCTETEFNYRRAHRELAAPDFEALSPALRDLYEQVCIRADGLSQASNLDMPWPEGMRETFDQFSDSDLANAARTAYYYGHWSPAGHCNKGGGGTWKFANYCDQVLCERLGVKRRGDGDYPRQIRIHQGYLRICFSAKDFWVWEEFARATAANLEALEVLTKDHLSGPKAYDSSQSLMADVRKAGKNCPGSGWLGEKFMDPKGTMAAEEEVVKEAARTKSLGDYVPVVAALAELTAIQGDTLYRFQQDVARSVRAIQIAAERGKDQTHAMIVLRGDLAVMSRRLREIADGLPNPLDHV